MPALCTENLPAGEEIGAVGKGDGERGGLIGGALLSRSGHAYLAGVLAGVWWCCARRRRGRWKRGSDEAVVYSAQHVDHQRWKGGDGGEESSGKGVPR